MDDAAPGHGCSTLENSPFAMQRVFFQSVFITCLVISGASARTINYSASGVFTLVSGADRLKLSGSSFTIQASIDSEAKPSSSTATSRTWGPITIDLTVTGKINRPIHSSEAKLTISHSASGHDTLGLAFPFNVAFLHLDMNAQVSLPNGALGSRPAPYPVTNLEPSTSTFSYSSGSRTTVLGLSGTTSAAEARPSAWLERPDPYLYKEFS